MKFGSFHLFFSQVDKGNMSFKWSRSQQVNKNRKLWFRQLGINKLPAIECEQSHGSKIPVIKDKPGSGLLNLAKADGLITDISGTVLILKLGDCLPIFICDKKKGAFGLIHAGWRGLDQSIHIKAIKLFQTHFNSEKNKLFVYLGPHIKKCCYLYKSFSNLSGKHWQKYTKQKDDLLSCDLTAFTSDTLRSAGILPDNIMISNHCTVCSGSYYSHYRAKKNNQKEARFAAIAYQE